jgi:chemotaxis protein methyltransferase CheR
MSKTYNDVYAFKPIIMVSDEELSSLMVAIRNRYGLDFTNYERASLKRGMGRLMLKHNMDSSLDLWARILNDKGFFSDAIDDLLVNLTELFRNPDVWIHIRDNILDEFQNKPISIWHAGCSTGEEVYTMSIVLEEKGVLARAKLLGSDLSKRALVKARNGDYSTEILKQYLNPFLKFFPRRKLEDYFDYHEKHATIKSAFKHNVTFKSHNLVNDPSMGEHDIIFCRNVMIYFDIELKKKVLELIYRSLKENGYFIIGYYDIMPEAGKKYFDLVDIKTRIYRKKRKVIGK